MYEIGFVDFVAGGELLSRLFIVKQAEPNLADVVQAMSPAGTRPSRLHGRQEQCHQNANDGNDDEELD